MEGDEKHRADEVLTKSTKVERNIRTLLSLENLIECGFLKEGVGATPEAGPSSARRASRKRRVREEASSSYVDVPEDEGMP